MLMASTKSLAQKNNETCYTPVQMARLNEYRKSCEQCKLDLTDTMETLKDANKRANESHAGTIVLVSLTSLVLGILIGGANANH